MQMYIGRTSVQNKMILCWSYFYPGKGCSLAPLFYLLITQPLMDILKEKARTGRIQGIEIRAEDKLVYEIFADDTGIFFEATEDSF
jgi:hypothetical protein